MKKLPRYINCKNDKIEFCEYYMSKHCKDTCAYAMAIGTDVVRDSKLIQKLEQDCMFMEVKE